MIHMSIDDSLGVLKDITESNYKSIFENEELAKFKRFHDKYGMVISLYFFYEQDNFNLSLVTDRYRDEFKENSDWLKLGFHAYNFERNYNEIKLKEAVLDYDLCMKELIRITGSDRCIDAFPRIHFFAGNSEVLGAWKNGEIELRGVLSADDDRATYYFDKKFSQYISSEDYYYDEETDLYFVPTDIRLENFRNHIQDALHNEENSEIVEVFTHENLLDEEMYRMIEEVCIWAKMNEYSFQFIQDIF